MTPEAGDIYLADLGGAVRQRVLVLSSARFHRIAERVIVAPAAGPRPYPWRIDVEDETFAVDLMRTVPVGVLLDVVGRASQADIRLAQRAVQLVL